MDLESIKTAYKLLIILLGIRPKGFTLALINAARLIFVYAGIVSICTNFVYNIYNYLSDRRSPIA